MVKTNGMVIEEVMSSKKTTPGTFVFAGDLGDEAMAKSLYIQRDAYPQGQPKKIKITIEVVK